MFKKMLCLICSFILLGLCPLIHAELLVHYNFDGSSGDVVKDVSGNGLDGVIDGVIDRVDGYMGNAVEFWGSESVTLPAEQMELTTLLGTVAFWANCDMSSAGNINTIFWAGDNTTGGGFGPENEMHVHFEQPVSNVWIGGELVFFAVSTPEFVFLHSDPEKGGSDERGDPPVNPYLMGDEEWHHAAATWDGANQIARLYYDGMLVFEQEYEPAIYELSNIFLGKMANGGRTYSGKLDDFRIYSDALTEQDIINLYDGTPVIDSQGSKLQKFVLNQNYPNPFNPSTTISFELPFQSMVSLKIYNVQGKEIITLTNQAFQAGSYNMQWNGKDHFGNTVPGGVYIYKLQANGSSLSQKMLLIK